jgi:hypothetical protein
MSVDGSNIVIVAAGFEGLRPGGRDKAQIEHKGENGNHRRSQLLPEGHYLRAPRANISRLCGRLRLVV